MSASFKPIPDFDLSKMAFAVTIPKFTVLPEKMPVSRVTTYAEFGQLGYPTARETSGDTFGDYVYSHFLETQGGPQFVFVKPRTGAEANSPVVAMTEYEMDYYPWPDVINWICAVEVKERPIQFEVRGRRTDVPSVEIRMSKIRGNSFACLHKTEYFVSHKPFPESFFKADPPVPGVIYFPFRNVVVDEYALHPAIELPPTSREGTVFQGFGYLPPNVTPKQPEVLPATNHLRWISHVAREKLTQQNGLYVVARLTVKPPKGIKRLEVVT